MAKKSHVSDEKKKVVAELVKLIEKYPVVASLNLENMPASPLQSMRSQLRKTVVMTMTKRRLMNIALEQSKAKKPGIENLAPHLVGMPALIFTAESPFKLSKILKRSRSPAPAKAGQIAPRDLIIPKGPTPFAPGPIISELAMVGIKSGVDKGKVVVKEDSLVAKKGDKITQKVAEVLTRLNILPMEIGLNLTAAYENGLIYDQGVLDIDEKGTLGKLAEASKYATNLAVYSSYPAKEIIDILLSKAHNEARDLGVSEKIIDKDIIDILIGRAEASMLNLKSTANIEVPDKKKEIQDNEEKALEEEKQILKEEIELEKPKKKIESPMEEEAEKEIMDEEEKLLENERVDKEKEFEELEKKK